MNRKSRLWLGLVLLLSGCAAPQVRYYSLAEAPRAPVQVSAAAAPYGVQLQVSGIPAEADRIQLVVQDPLQAPAVQVLNESLWVAPLRDQIQRQLAGGVSARLGVPEIARSSGAHAPAVRSIVVQVTRFDLIWGEAAWLGARWTDRLPGSRSAQICQVVLSGAAGTSVSSLVRAQQHLLDTLSAVIANPDSSVQVSPESNEISKGCTS